MNKLINSIFLFTILLSVACVTQGNEIQAILNQKDAPPGIVFEVVSLLMERSILQFLK